MKTGKIRIRPGEAGKAKGGKGRVVYMGKSARTFVWRYLAEREDGEDPDAPLFLGKFHRAFNSGCSPADDQFTWSQSWHQEMPSPQFRHTFAITYLRSGGDIFTLKLCLGTAAWTWWSIMLGSLKWILSRRIEKPAQPIIGGFSSLRKLQ